MPSQAAINYAANDAKAGFLVSLASNRQLRPISNQDVQTILHAGLAAYVACWDAYIKALTREFITESSDPTIPKFLALHSIVQSRLEAYLSKFNTPNAENVRDLLLSYTGYDPINDWIWTRRGMNGLNVRARLNETLKVRHSFAHGSPMPSYTWNTSPTGSVRLTVASLNEAKQFLRNLVLQTDRGLARHIRAQYNPALSW